MDATAQQIANEVALAADDDAAPDAKLAAEKRAAAADAAGIDRGEAPKAKGKGKRGQTTR